MKDHSYDRSKRFFDHQPVKTISEHLIKFKKMHLVKVMIKQLVFSLDYSDFKEYYQPIAVDLSKLQKLDTDPKAMQKLILLEI